jgi:uncharacterized protein YecE (DUF72 family)
VEVRHESFRVPEFVALLRKYGIATVLTDKAEFPEIADVTADFVYLRLQRSQEKEKTGYPPKELDGWAERARAWATGGSPRIRNRSPRRRRNRRSRVTCSSS